VQVDGSQHCFTDSDLFYSADAKGPEGGKGGGMTLVEWVRSLAKGEGTVDTICEGDRKARLPLPPLDTMNNTYCSTGLVPKQFTLR